MNIMEVGGASHHAAFAPVGAVQRPESAEAPGAPDHDGDSDDAATGRTGELTVGRPPRLRPYAALAVHTSVVWTAGSGVVHGQSRQAPKPSTCSRARATPARRAAPATIVVNRSGPQMNTSRSDRSGMLALRV